LKKAVRSITRAVSGVFSAQVNAAKRYLDWNVRVAEKAAHNPYVRTAAAVAAGFYGGFGLAGAYGWGEFGAGVSGGFIAGGIESGNLQGAAYGGVTGGLFAGVTGATPFDGFGSALSPSGYPTALGTAKFIGHQALNGVIRDEVGAYAASRGYSLTDFNLRLFGLSALGNGLFGSRLTNEPGAWKSTEWGIRGWDTRGPLAYPFDAVDTILAYQGLPTATSIHYLFSNAYGQPLSGHSLGALDVANLSGLGLVSRAQYFALPFGKVATGGDIHLGSSDLISGTIFGFPLGAILNPDAVVDGSTHPCANYPGCGP
jgi:hypothetical protein